MNPEGRPSKYETPEAMQKDAEAYFARVDHRCTEKCKKDFPMGCEIREYPTITGLAMALDMSTETLRRYAFKDEFRATVIKAKQIVEYHIEKSLLSGKGHPVGKIFWLKNNAPGWKDTIQQEQTGKDGGPIETVELDPKQYAKTREQMLKQDDC